MSSTVAVFRRCRWQRRTRLGVAHNSSLEELRSLLEVAAREAQQPQLGEAAEETPDGKTWKTLGFLTGHDLGPGTTGTTAQGLCVAFGSANSHSSHIDPVF